ncbi:MAG: hypothetical protein LAO05_17290 [Acidobacteriia bacterium]|nr:hypothetical protein [Terriglobia bacterium]
MSDPRTPRVLAIVTLVVGIGVPLATMASNPLTVLPFGNHAQGSYSFTAGLQGSYSKAFRAAGLQGSYTQPFGVSRDARLQSSYSQSFGRASSQGSYSVGNGRTVVAGADATAKLPMRAAGLTVLFAAVALGVACLPPRKK